MFSLSALAQSAALKGIVTDPHGASVPNVQITLTDEKTGAVQHSKTDETGVYSLPAVPGIYTLTAERDGFKRFEEKAITVEAAHNLTVDVKLQVGDRKDTVEVVAIPQGDYHVETLTPIGPFKGLSSQDTPYSMSVVSQALINDIQPGDQAQILMMAPFVQPTSSPYQDNRATGQLRGLGSYYNTEDGFYIDDRSSFTQDVERLEVFEGPAGFAYGTSCPGGTLNYILKRPTITPFATLTTGNYGGGELLRSCRYGRTVAVKRNLGLPPEYHAPRRQGACRRPDHPRALYRQRSPGCTYHKESPSPI
jgi:iron complex outermembrane receptor protein